MMLVPLFILPGAFADDFPPGAPPGYVSGDDVVFGSVTAVSTDTSAPAKVTSFTSTVTGAARTITFASAVDWALAKVGSTLIADGDTRIIVAIGASPTVTVDANITWAGATAITSLQEPIAQMKTADGTVVGYITASGLNSMEDGLYVDTDALVVKDGKVGIGTTDLDGTPATGQLTVKGTTADGSTNILVGRDSAEANVFSVDTDGNIVAGETVTLNPTTLPGVEFTDDDGADDDVSAKIYHNLTTVTTAGEIGDMFWQVMGAETAGTLGTFMSYDGSNKTLSSVGGQIKSVTAVAAATYDLLVSDYILSVTYTGTAAVTSLTLPTAQMVSGRIIHITDTGGGASGNNITIDTAGAEKISGADTQVISTDYGSLSLFATATGWFIF